MKRLSEVMATAIGDPAILEGIRAHRVLRRWEEAVGGLLASKTTPDKFEKGTVWVASTGSAWAQEVRMRREEIVVRLNRMAGEDLFQDIRVGVRPPRMM